MEIEHIHYIKYLFVFAEIELSYFIDNMCYCFFVYMFIAHVVVPLKNIFIKINSFIMCIAYFNAVCYSIICVIMSMRSQIVSNDTGCVFFFMFYSLQELLFFLFYRYNVF